MPPEVQARLLRVLQDGQVYRVGGRDPRPAQARIVSATNRDVDALLASGGLRLDLYHRIADWRVTLPALRERRADIPNLAAHFLARESARRRVQPAGISRAALDALIAFPWPGNLRQLEREMARAALFVDDGQLLERRHLQATVASAPDPAPSTLKGTLEAVERREIERALAEAGDDTATAAAALGIARSTLYRRMKELAIALPTGGQ
jgi:transcriptional regulator with PAS, ATPase and Fis domain